jgi:hypothetical protein
MVRGGSAVFCIVTIVCNTVGVADWKCSLLSPLTIYIAIENMTELLYYVTSYWQLVFRVQPSAMKHL